MPFIITKGNKLIVYLFSKEKIEPLQKPNHENQQQSAPSAKGITPEVQILAETL